MLKKLGNTACVTACLVAVGAMAQAGDEIDIQAALDAAMPHMHHSCASVLETYPDDDKAVEDIVRQMAFVSIYNRQLDVLALVPDEVERESLKVEFVKDLENACADDPGRLLAGAVDDAIKNTMAPFD